MRINKIMVCWDCLFFHSTGEFPADSTEARDAEIVAGFDRIAASGQQPATGDLDNVLEFSGRTCECCGSGLGGSRHEMNLLDG